MDETVELEFYEDEEYKLPDTHEWIDITSYEDRARGIIRLIRGLEKTEKCSHCGAPL